MVHFNVHRIFTRVLVKEIATLFTNVDLPSLQISSVEQDAIFIKVCSLSRIQKLIFVSSLYTIQLLKGAIHLRISFFQLLYFLCKNIVVCLCPPPKSFSYIRFHVICAEKGSDIDWNYPQL